MKLLEFYGLLEQVGIPVFHYEADLIEYPYIVYQEFASRFIIASNNANTERTMVEVIHYTLKEFDPSFMRLKEILLKNGIFFSVATTYNRERKEIINQLEVELVHEVGGAIV